MTRRIRQAVTAALFAALASSVVLPATALAHGPDPLFGTRTWKPNQVVGYTWESGAAPPSWMTAAIDAGAHDVAESRASRAATFIRQAGAPSTIAYGTMPCASYAIACVDRTGVPVAFNGIWFRPQGWVYDWGTLRWCQAQSTFTDGCFDVENITLDELGHVEILGHHVNYGDERDYTDAVVQAYSRSRPDSGWNAHAFGDCDVARLQLEYALSSASARVSTCLSLETSLSLVASPASGAGGQTVTFTATLRIASDSDNRALSGDPLKGRTVILQHRLSGGSWSTVATMANGSNDGTYVTSWSATMTFDWRAVFSSPTSEGLEGSVSSTISVPISGCITRCPTEARA